MRGNGSPRGLDFPRALLEQLPTLKFISQVGRSAQTVDREAGNALGIADRETFELYGAPA